MSDNFLTAALLASSLCRLFPEAKPLSVRSDCAEFVISFYFPYPNNEMFQGLLENHLIELLRDPPDIRQHEMVRDNAAELFYYHGQEAQASLCSEYEQTLCPVLQVGDFYLLGQTKEEVPPALIEIFSLFLKEGILHLRGAGFANKMELKQGVKKRIEAEERDHNVIGQEMELFAPLKEGIALLEKGVVLKKILLDWESSQSQASRVSTPHSGSVTNIPMLHAELFKSFYRRNPCCLSETILVQATEQDKYYGLFQPANYHLHFEHTFSTENQVKELLTSSLQFITKTINILGFKSQWTLTQRSSMSVGTEKDWDIGTQMLIKALQECQISFKNQEDVEGAQESFLMRGVDFGPKAQLLLFDTLGRAWNCSHVGVDCYHPQKMDLTIQGADEDSHIPWMINQSFFGPIERFIAILVEQFAGQLPLWLSPEQLRVIPVNKKHHSRAEQVVQELCCKGWRATVDSDELPIGARVRNAELLRVPYLIVIGEEEMNTNTVAIRACVTGKVRKHVELEAFLEEIRQEKVAGIQDNDLDEK